MHIAVFRAHYDGRHVVLDEPCELPTNTPLLITVFGSEAERFAWASLSAQNLARAYCDEEPDYTVADLRR